MASCLFKNPSRRVLLACSFFGAGLTLVGVPAVIYYSCRFLSARCEAKNQSRLPRYYNLPSAPIKPELSPLEYVENDIKVTSFCIAVGSALTIGSSASIFSCTKSFAQKFRSSPLIQTVCCNRIRFFAIVALFEGTNLGGFIVGSVVMFNGSKRLRDLFKKRSSLIKNQ